MSVSDVKHASLGNTTRVTVHLPARQQQTPYLTIFASTRVARCDRHCLCARASRFLAPCLFATAPSEPSLHAASVVVLASAALAGAWLPARRVSRTNPRASFGSGSIPPS